MLFTPVLSFVALNSLANAHFILNYPSSLGFDDDIEATAPCGGFDVVFADNDTSVQVEGFAVALRSTHPAADFLYRATLSKQAPYNWTDILPVVSETGLGDFCLPDLSVPQDYAGQQGLVQVIQQGPDGILYQCAAVKFVTGMNTTVGSGCTNSTGLTASLTNESTFLNSTNDPSSTTSSMASGAAGTPTSTASSSSSSAAGVMTTPAAQALLAGLGVLALL